MNYQEFSNKLEKLSITKKDFAEKTGLSQSSVTNWKSVDRIPSWVDGFLENYEKASAYDLIKNKVLEVENKK